MKKLKTNEDKPKMYLVIYEKEQHRQVNFD